MFRRKYIKKKIWERGVWCGMVGRYGMVRLGAIVRFLLFACTYLGTASLVHVILFVFNDDTHFLK